MSAAHLCKLDGCGRPARAGRRDCQAHHNRQTSVSRRRRGLGGRQGKGSRKRKRSVYTAITREEWVAIYDQQGGKCAICEKPLTNRYDQDGVDEKGAVANLDHGHAAEREFRAQGLDDDTALRLSVRGLLCFWCNRNVIGVALKDSARIARRAADYLDRPPARKIIPIRNAAKCAGCGDVIESKHTHDFVTCSCGAVSVDGGREYRRRVGNLGMIVEVYA